MKYGKLLASLVFLTVTGAALGNETQKLSGPTKLEGYCTKDGHRETFFKFVLIQDPLGGLESKSTMVPDTAGAATARVTVEYETASNGGKFYHARFFIYSFSGDLAVLESRMEFEWMDHEQVLESTLQTKAGVKVSCVADVLNAN